MSGRIAREAGGATVVGPEPGPLLASPYLHRYTDRVTSPITGTVLVPPDPLFDVVREAIPGQPFRPAADLAPEDLARLLAGAFLVSDLDAAGRRSRLTCVSLETSSVCTHRCVYCPVARAPRPGEVMPQELFERIVQQVLAVAEPGAAVFLSNYNEPTADPLLLDRLGYLFARRVPVAILSNGSHLTPELAGRIRAMGRLRLLGLNLPSVDGERHRALHGTSDLDRVLANVDHVIEHPIAQESYIVVLGWDDARHDEDFRAVAARFGGRGTVVRREPIGGRVGLVKPAHAVAPRRSLGGCDLMGSRPFEHLHVVAGGRVVLCCQDYEERHVIGDLTRQTVAEVLASDAMLALRRQVYGVDQAPAGFICRHCEFTIESPATATSA
jgi:pyruvate-formate lyase-activating enzyme